MIARGEIAALHARLERVFGEAGDAEVARRIGHLSTTVRGWRLRKNCPRYDGLVSVIRAYGVSAQWLMTGEGTMRPIAICPVLENEGASA